MPKGIVGLPEQLLRLKNRLFANKPSTMVPVETAATFKSVAKNE
jgi:hypothetical protein